MVNVLLLGAGFSANWGAPLARDLFNWLIQHAAIARDERLKRILWDNRDVGGFENALSQIQTDYLTSKSQENEARLITFQNALDDLFKEIDRGFSQMPTWEFNNDLNRSIAAFLTRFDAIFSLNQDQLVERFYAATSNPTLASNQRWNGCILPGMREQRADTGLYDIGQSTWTPNAAEFKVPERFQPFFKLHGSHRWLDDGGNRLMIVGGSKSLSIQSHAVLKWYYSEFCRFLKLGATRIMVIGYGFGDHHINEALSAAEARGIKMFIVDPLGVDVANPSRNLPLKMPNPFQNIIESASQIPFSQTFGSNLIEHARLLKFFR